MGERTGPAGSVDGRAAAAAGLALALVAVVALCSSTTPWRSSGSATEGSELVLASLAAIGAVALVVGAVVLWVGTPPQRRRRRQRRILSTSDLEGVGAALSTAVKTASLLMLVVALFSLLAFALASRPDKAATSRRTAEPDAPAGSSDSQGSRPARSVDLGWLLVPLGIGLAVLLPVAVVARRRRFAGARSVGGEQETLGGVVRVGISELESVRDPREAVLRAYAGMERALADLEIVRAPDETASELLSRTARRLSASGKDAGWLTERFEEARFSTHPITEHDRERALTSLRSIERELANPGR